MLTLAMAGGLALISQKVGAQASSSCDQHLEKLNRGLVGVSTDGGVFLSWRLLATDDADISFDIFRDGNLVNTQGHLSAATSYTDKGGGKASQYTLKAIDAKGKTVETVKLDSVWTNNYLKIPLDVPKPGKTKDGREYRYSPNDCSVGDVNGDGQYEIILKWDPSNAHDNSHSGYTGNVLLDCYTLDGRKLWRIDLGPNIRAGAHYTQFVVFDFNGDGKAELACKTAPGSVDGEGNYVSSAATDKTILATDNKAFYPNGAGHILAGPEFYTIFSGATGKALHTVAYEPSRDIRSLDKDGWGDGYGNRSERYLSCVAFLPGADGKPTPSMVASRGYYTYAFVCAWQFDGKHLRKVWMYETPSRDYKTTLYGAGAHSMLAADVDGDGFDEIVYGAASLDHDGTFLYSTGWGHGDALHISDMDPDRPGMEVFMPHEAPHHAGLTLDGEPMDYGHEFRDAKTGEIIFGARSNFDNGRGMAADIDSTSRGYELWSLESKNIYDVHGNVVSSNAQKFPPVNFRVYWDGDLQDELLDGGMPRTNFNPNGRGRGRRNGDRGNQQRQGGERPVDMEDPHPGKVDSTWFVIENSEELEKERTAPTPITKVYKWDSEKKNTFVLEELKGATCNGTKRTPNISGDLFGDWREEVVLNDGKSLIIYTTTIPTPYRIVTLMHDHTYRMSIATQNSAYNQPPHVGYYLPDKIKLQKK